MGVEQLPDEGITETDKDFGDERVVYVFGGTLLFTAIIALVNYFGHTGPIAEKTVDGSYGIIELLVLGFIFTKSVDRSEVLKNIGVGLRNYGSFSHRAKRTQLTDGRDPADIPATPTKEDSYG